jgi:hypothetical protein
LDDTGKSSCDIAKILNFIDILKFFGFFLIHNYLDDFLKNEKNKNLMQVFHFYDFKFIYN